MAIVFRAFHVQVQGRILIEAYSLAHIASNPVCGDSQARGEEKRASTDAHSKSTSCAPHAGVE